MCSVFKVELSQGCPFMNERERERKRERERERGRETWCFNTFMPSQLVVLLLVSYIWVRERAAGNHTSVTV